MGNTQTTNNNNNNTSTPTQTTGGCPVIHTNKSNTIMVEESSASGCPVKHDNNNNNQKKLPPITIRVDPRNMMPITPENYNKRKEQEQNINNKNVIPLSKQRQVSSIPKGEFTPKHQDKEKGGQDKTWVYPSEQMFYNAMERKGWDPNAEDMKSVVQIHNAVNERTWMELLKWEKIRNSSDDDDGAATGIATVPPPRLVRFQGRPNDLSPKALFKMYILGYTKPFDRHDWYVDRGDGSEPIRYIIDFYSGNLNTSNGGSDGGDSNNPMMKRQSNDGRIGFHLDVRPALDSFESIKCRVKGALFM